MIIVDYITLKKRYVRFLVSKPNSNFINKLKILLVVEDELPMDAETEVKDGLSSDDEDGEFHSSDDEGAGVGLGDGSIPPPPPPPGMRRPAREEDEGDFSGDDEPEEELPRPKKKKTAAVVGMFGLNRDFQILL